MNIKYLIFGIVFIIVMRLFRYWIVKQNECDFYLNFKEGVVEIICQPVDDIDEVLTQIQKII